MLLGSNALASAPLAADQQHAFRGELAYSQLLLTAAAIKVAAALFSGAAAARQGKVARGGMPVLQDTSNSIRISKNRTVIL